jgi:dCMP deaminase
MREYDYLLDDLESWDRCSDVIPWVDSEGKTRHYNPDFLLVYRDGHNVVEEVKGRVTDDDVRKMAAARDWYEGKNVAYRMFCMGDFRDEPQVMTKVYTNDYGVFSRPTLEYVFMRMAYALAERSTCLRKKVGVVLTDPEMQHAYCLGYNGSERGGPNQCESLKPGKCNCVHAEMNALTKNNANITGATCFVTTSPCPVCAKLLVNRGISRVIYGEAYRNSRGIQILLDHGIEVIKYDKLVESFGDTL